MSSAPTQTHTESFTTPFPSLIWQGVLRYYAGYFSVGGACDV